MNGLREIKAANRAATGPDYRVQRDRLAQVLRKVLVTGCCGTAASAGLGAADAEARKVLVEIFGEDK